ncbi:histone-lysine N-methyltransferase SETMAR [Plakobranchus ocellatus]|uniref:Histone-lysine N-methyltransferase SETMAR n=1 Tax=Plakobranchus ocellatus TaxID=259542 RepID=A0AAV4DK64_9GAST|nr:histone-lysine N-methyltransferase SETMAR [Plakobranchus ocellatus]
MYLTDMSVPPILLLLGVLVGPSFQGMPMYWVSNVFPRSKSIYFLSKRITSISINRRNELCKSIGGYLVELDSREEQDFVNEFARAHSSSHAFTGANDIMLESTFVYYNSKKPMPALKWVFDNPNNWLGDEDCVLTMWFGLNDIDCLFGGQHICEVKLKG